VIAGVDGCRGGWVAATAERGAVLYESFEALVRDHTLILVDVPIGLPDGPRVCDVEARQLLGARRSSIFPAPPRSLLRARSYRGQCSIQLWNILYKIREADAAMTPALQRRVREGHPESSFAKLNGAPLRWPKKTAQGARERLRLLRPIFGEIERLKGAALDDVLDAYALLWTARRVEARQALALGDPKQRDQRGLRCQIWL
jgi:predicted RNase H-like nuclease